MPAQRSELLWKALAIAAVAGAAAGATKVVSLTWKKVTDTEVPLNVAPGVTSRRREIIWVVASGIAVALVRLVARRGLARLWRAKTGEYPRELVESPAAV
jgi:hypothetical protein